MKKVLITGAGGVVGSALVRGLRETGKYEIIATERLPAPESGLIGLDVRDAGACEAALAGVDTVIHGAWHMKEKSMETFTGEQLQSNVVGTVNIYEAARKNGVKRVIFLSSNHVVGFYRIEDKVDEQSPMRPDSGYGLNKCFGELLGGYYADRYGISCVNLRIGNVSAEDAPQSPRITRIYLSQRDCVSLLERVIDLDESVKRLTLFATSANSRNYWDISSYGALLGYYPQDDGEAYVESAAAINKFGGTDDTPYMGGGLTLL